MLMGGYVRGGWEIDFSHSMACYVLTMNNCGKVREGSNEGIYWMFPQFHAIKDTSVSFTTNKILQVCIGKVGGFKWSDTAGTSICCGSSDDMGMNPTLDVLSSINRGGWDL